MAEMTASQKLDLAVRHYRAKEFDQAAGLCQEILRWEPGQTDVLNLLAAIDFEAGRAEAALQRVRRAIELQGGVAGYHFNEGEICGRLGRGEESIAAYRRAVALRPDLAEAWHGLGNALREAGKSAEMLDAFARAVSLRPEDASWQAELAGHLAQQGRADDAMAAYGRALLIRPDFAEAHLNLGNLYKDTGRLDEALECFDRARKVRPNYHHALSNRLNTIHFHERFGPAELLREARKFDDVFAWPLRGEIRPLTNDRSPDRRLKVGYVSPDFRKHCQSFFTIPLLSHHDHRGFEIYAYAQLAKEDDVTRRIRGYCDVWLNTAGLSDKELADRIRHDEIDILVDLTMHMGDGRPLVFARKPAPVQVAWLAYPGTTGLAAIDYRLTDAYLDPPGERDGFYSERSVRLAHSFWCYDPLGVDVPVNRLPASDAGYVTFGCLSHVCKYSDRALELWGAVLRAVPGSRMIVADATEQHRQRVIKKLGVEAGRIEFQGKLPIPEYLHVYHRIDLGLDAFPYNGHTTSLDSLWMGVPVVSLCGQTAVSRGGWSQLSNLGLGDQFVSRSDEEFVEVSARWARDLAGLAELRGSLRRRMESSPLMDGEGFTRDVESVYRRLWRQWAGAK